MLVLEGKGICGGVVFGEISFYQHARPTLERRQISDPEQEIRRLEAARLKAAEELEALYKKALSHAGEDGASIFQIHQMMPR